jgi:transcriptional regulator with XRE-family HTH domain
MTPPPAQALALRALGPRIRALREERGLTQERLARACGRSKGYLSDIEAGHRLPSLPVLAELAEHLQVELFDLFVTPGVSPRADAVEAGRPRAGR